jgi:hypothetical protein
MPSSMATDSSPGAEGFGKCPLAAQGDSRITIGFDANAVVIRDLLAS